MWQVVRQASKPRTSVWLSVDPLAEKYPGFSSYVYCLDNPVKYVDPDGKRVLVALSTSTESKPVFVQYKNNNLYNKDGSLYKGNDKFAIKTRETLNGLLNTKDEKIQKVINTLIDSKNPHTIQLDKSEKGDRSYSAPQGKNYIGANDGQSIGSNIVVNYKNNSLEDNLENNSYTELGHELRHSYDYDQGKFKDTMFKYEYERFKDPAEKRAVGFENLIRKSFKLDLRVKYGENKIKYTKNEDL